MNASMRALRRSAVVAAVCGALACPAHAGLMDFLFGTRAAAEPTAARPGQRDWRIGEFTAIRLVPAEAGAAANQHPAQVQPEVLRQQLALLRTSVKGQNQPLFGAEELGELIEPLAQALAVASPADDLLLLSTSRRGDGFLVAPTGVTARMFIQGGGLNVLVRDARYDFVSMYRGTQIPPQFTFGTRSAAGPASVQMAGGASRRADWVVVPLALPAGGVGAAAAAPAAAAAAVLPAAAPPPPATSPAAAAAPAVAAQPRVRDAAFAEEIEQRLATLKRLRDRGLISEDEYQAKRREILALL